LEVPSQDVIAQSYIKVQLAREFRLELAGPQLDNDVPELFDVEEEQVNVVVIAVHFEVHLPTDEGKPWLEFLQGFGDSCP
jgi:hypothetical protein